MYQVKDDTWYFLHDLSLEQIKFIDDLFDLLNDNPMFYMERNV